ncbi:MAG: hypothetical protein Q9165_003674 [Trypethelium subeluteriae]
MTSNIYTAVHASQNVQDMLRLLHEQSLAQERQFPDMPIFDQIKTSLQSEVFGSGHEVMHDKFIALTADKASFMYELLRAKGALNVVEAGTSFGVSTIYIALAVGQNATATGKKPGEAKVIATEYEHSKAERAREHWRAAGSDVEAWIELREGDLRETLKENLPEIDFVLLDSTLNC